jgi:hypothetical protein
MPIGRTSTRVPNDPVALIQLEELKGRIRVALARIDTAMATLAGNRPACDALLDVRLDLCPPKPQHPGSR